MVKILSKILQIIELINYPTLDRSKDELLN